MQVQTRVVLVLFDKWELLQLELKPLTVDAANLQPLPGPATV